MSLYDIFRIHKKHDVKGSLCDSYSTYWHKGPEKSKQESGEAYPHFSQIKLALRNAFRLSVIFAEIRAA